MPDPDRDPAAELELERAGRPELEHEASEPWARHTYDSDAERRLELYRAVLERFGEARPR